MKINFIAPGLYKSGGMRVIYEISNGLANKGHDVTLYSPIIPYNSFKGISTFYAYKFYYWTLGSVFMNRKNVKYFNSGKFRLKNVLTINNHYISDADVVIATAWPTAFSVKKLSQNKGEKFYFIQGYETWNSNINKVHESYELGLNSITTCKYLQKLIFNKFGVKSEKIFCGIDFNLFSNPQKKYTIARTITFIHNGQEKKNIPAAIRILEVIKSKFPEIKIVSFGTMAYPGLPEYFTTYINPSEEEIKNIYCNSDIFLFTSKEEGFGLPPSEAMACKAAVVTTNVGAIPEYCENGFSAFVHEVSDENGMIESIEKLITDPELLKYISENGYNSVKEKFDWQKSINKFEKYLLQNLSL